MTHYEVDVRDVWPGADDEDRGQLVLAEDEEVLDAEFRGSNRIVVAVLTPVEGDSCGVCGCTGDCRHDCCR